MTYRWRRTSPDREDDGQLFDGDLKVGRVYAHWDKVRWQWFLQLDPASSGISDSKDAAKADLVAAYERIKK